MQALCVNWSNLKLPWVDLDWLIDISCQITELDLSANCLVSLPSVIPWGLINLRKLSLADNQLTELPSVQSSDEIICTRCVHWMPTAKWTHMESRCKWVSCARVKLRKWRAYAGVSWFIFSLLQDLLCCILSVSKLVFRAVVGTFIPVLSHVSSAFLLFWWAAFL